MMMSLLAGERGLPNPRGSGLPTSEFFDQKQCYVWLKVRGERVKVLVNVHQRVILAEENFNNWVDGMAHSVDTSLSPATLIIITQWAHNEVVMVAAVTPMHGAQHNGLPLTKAVATLGVPSALSMAAFPGVISQIPRDKLITLTASVMEGAVFCPYGNRHLLLIQICISCMQCFCQNYHLWTYKKPYLPSWYSTQHCLWSRNSIHSKRTVVHGIHWSHPVPHQHKAATLIECGMAL